MSSGESEQKATALRRQGIGRGVQPPGRRTTETAQAEAPPPVTVQAASASESDVPSSTDEKKTLRKIGRRGPAVAEKAPPAGEGQRESPPESSSPGHEKLEKEIAELKLVKRKNYGSFGKSYRMRANHFEIRFKSGGKNLLVHQYSVGISHDRIQKLTPDENRFIFWKCVSTRSDVFNNQYSHAYDGSKQMFSLKELKFPNSNTSCTFADIPVQLPRDEKVLMFKCVMQYLGPTLINIETVGISPQAEQTIAPVQILDIIFRQYRSHPSAGMENAFYPFRRNVFRIPTTIGVDLGSGKELWTGMYHAVHVCENNKMFLNVDLKMGAFYRQKRKEDPSQDFDAIDFMIDCLNTYQPRAGYRRNQLHLMRTGLSQDLLEVLKKDFSGVYVKTTHRPGVNMRKRVIGLHKSPSAERFTNREGREMSVLDYFKEVYNVDVHPHLPTLNVGTKSKPIALPMDVCIIDKKQNVSKKLTEQQTTITIRQATEGGAPNRFAKTNQIFRDGDFNRDPFLNEFQLEVSNEMVVVDGRVLPPPNMVQRERARNGSKQPRTEVNKGRQIPARLDFQNSYKFEQGAFANAAIIKSVGCVVCARDSDLESCRRFMQEQLRTLGDLGCIVPDEPHWVVNSRFTPEDVKKALEEIKRQMESIGKPLVENGVVCGIVFVLVPQRNSSVYAAVKQTAEINLGIMTQVVQLRTFEKRATINISLKVNLKMRGLNSVLEPHEMGEKLFYEKKTLLMGVDVSHPSPLDKKSPSVAAIVANIDSKKDSFQFAASLKIQKKRRESIVYLVDAVKERLIKYFTITKEKPERIIVYRDGVSEGQFADVLREEIRSIREACMALSTDYRPKVTYIIVTKRHNTRLYPMDQGCGKSCNVQPGAVVDRTIVSNDVFDFYLCSHYGIQGTSRSGKYTVLSDDSRFDADEIQLLTFYTTFMYQRAARSVSIPAPVYYADLACTRARAHLNSLVGEHSESTPSEEKEDKQDTTIPEEDLVRQTTVAESLRDRMYFV